MPFYSKTHDYDPKHTLGLVGIPTEAQCLELVPLLRIHWDLLPACYKLVAEEKECTHRVTRQQATRVGKTQVILCWLSAPLHRQRSRCAAFSRKPTMELAVFAAAF